jgi:hypothetical protein
VRFPGALYSLASVLVVGLTRAGGGANVTGGATALNLARAADYRAKEARKYVFSSARNRLDTALLLAYSPKFKPFRGAFLHSLLARNR